MKHAYKRPESVLVLIYTRAGEVLLLQRQQPADFWQSVTGSLEWDEDPQSAAHRELLEETGLVAGDALRDCGTVNRFPILPAWRHRYAPDISFNTEHVFRLEYEARPRIQLHSAEHRVSLWLPRRDALERVSSSTNRDAIAQWVPESRSNDRMQ